MTAADLTTRLRAIGVERVGAWLLGGGVCIVTVHVPNGLPRLDACCPLPTTAYTGEGFSLEEAFGAALRKVGTPDVVLAPAVPR